MSELLALTGQSCARAIRNLNRTNRLRARAQSWTGQCLVRPANPSFSGAYSRNLSRQDWTGQRDKPLLGVAHGAAVRSSCTTTISTFLWMSIDATLSLSAIVSSWRGSGRTRGTIHYAPSRATTLPAGRGGATKIGSKHAFRVKLLHGLNSSRAATTFTVPRRIHNTTLARADFHPYHLGPLARETS